MEKRFRGSSNEKVVYESQNNKIDTKKLKNIKVEIKRKISGNNETNEMDRSLERLEEIKIYRCQGEGSRPIFDRSDIIVNREETERRTVSAYSPQRSPSRQNNSHKSSDNYTSFGSDSPRRAPGSPRRNDSRLSRSPKRENKSSKSNRNSPQRDYSKPGSSREHSSSSRNRSRSREGSRRSRRSKSRSSWREFGRRRNSRSPDDRDRRRYDRRNYVQTERDRRRERSRSPRYARSSPRRRSRDRPLHNPHLAPIDPATVIPLIIPPFYGPEDAIWFPPPMRPPIFVPPGMGMPPRGIYRPPMPGMRPPMPGRPPYGPRQPPFRHVRPQNRPQLQ